MKRLPTLFRKLFALEGDGRSVHGVNRTAPADSGPLNEIESATIKSATKAAANAASLETEVEIDGPVDPNALAADTPLHNGAFTIDRVLGRGGLSITYLSHSVASGQKVVIKEFFPPGAQRSPGATGPGGTAVYNVLPGGYCTGENYQQACAAFLEKARSVSRVWHPNVVMIYDTFAENNTAYTVMKFLQGNTLQELLEERSLSELEAVAYAMLIGQGLEALHKAGLIHGDIHPGNVMVCGQSPIVPAPTEPALDTSVSQAPAGEGGLAGLRVFLIDCGLNRLPSVNTSPSSTRLGSARAGSSRPGGTRPGGTRLQTRALREPQPIGAAGYAPLEQYGSNRPVGPQTDVYALGATLYHLLTGQVPVEALDRAQGERLPDPYSLNPRVSRPLSDAVMWALGLQSAERPSTVRAFLERLSHCAGEAASKMISQTSVSLSGQSAIEQSLASRGTAVLQSHYWKTIGRGDSWAIYSRSAKQRLGLAALLSTTIGLAMWTLWRESTPEPQPSQEVTQGVTQRTAKGVIPLQQPAAAPSTVAVPPGLRNPDDNKKAAEDNTVNKRTTPTIQSNTAQAHTAHVETAQDNTPEVVRRSAASVPSSEGHLKDLRARKDTDGGRNVETIASQSATAKRSVAEPESRLETNRVEASRATVDEHKRLSEERISMSTRNSPAQKNQAWGRTLVNVLRGRQRPENRNSLRASSVPRPARRNRQQQQITEKPSSESRVPSWVSPRNVPRRRVQRRSLERRNAPRRVIGKSTLEADLPQLPDTVPQNEMRRGTTSEADLPPG